jgi:hypothetical protein
VPATFFPCTKWPNSLYGSSKLKIIPFPPSEPILIYKARTGASENTLISNNSLKIKTSGPKFDPTMNPTEKLQSICLLRPMVAKSMSGGSDQQDSYDH